MQIVVFPNLQEIDFVHFFKIVEHFPFQVPQAMVYKKKWVHRVNFLVISAINEKSGLENPFRMLPW